jgi:hypothetical protein
MKLSIPAFIPLFHFLRNRLSQFMIIIGLFLIIWSCFSPSSGLD